MTIENLTPAQIEEALHNSGYEFNSKITDAEMVGTVEGHDAYVYEVSWDPAQQLQPEIVTFCNTIYISVERDGKLYGDI